MKKPNQFPSPEQSPNPSSFDNLKWSISESLIQQIGADWSIIPLPWDCTSQATMRAKSKRRIYWTETACPPPPQTHTQEK
jgi:hypothetical protein